MQDGRPIGVLQADDPLHLFLCEEVAGRVLGLGPLASPPAFKVYRLGPREKIHWVYRYTDRDSGLDLVCKFYGTKTVTHGGISNRAQRAEWMQREFDNLERVRALGLDRPPHRFVRPLAASTEINCVLVEEHVAGKSLGDFLTAAVDRGEGALYERLVQVAAFLADLHGRSTILEPVDGPWVATQLRRLADQLVARGTVGAAERDRMAAIAERWSAAGVLSAGRKAWVHGDSGPSHFLFGDGPEMTAIDLEILRAADPAEDLGRMMAELKQAFFQATGDLWASEPYIRHFSAAYLSCLPAGIEDPAALMERCRFYMGFYEASVGRNFTLDLQYRRDLIQEALVCLRL